MGREKNITKLKYWQDSLTNKAGFAAGKTVILFLKRGLDEVVKKLGWQLPNGVTGIVAGVAGPIVGDMVAGVVGDKGDVISNALNSAGDSMFYDSVVETVSGQKPDAIINGLGSGSMSGDGSGQLLAGPYDGELLTPTTMNNAHLGETMRNMLQMRETPTGYESNIGLFDENTGQYMPSNVVKQMVLSSALQEPKRLTAYGLSGDDDERRKIKRLPSKNMFGDGDELEKLEASEIW
ncbi:MAG: hypothetical protein AMQ22_01074 [Candidatus Methanofastidiosum methylothiophilum]|uniref:Uncharacterized protein n=1 Tax=Candidatus Methanofastidiosum methylothiophilum TaxID=1705564 RepID=A0A150J3Z3_9EURY|nr:MAG: hypothetical protein AMQ22_01074 [Candidatus Methanofastidiosum methylthiophilus]